MNQLVYVFGGLFFVSVSMYFLFPEKLKLWVALGMSSLAATLVGFWGYEKVYILLSFGVIFIVSLLGMLIRK